MPSIVAQLQRHQGGGAADSLDRVVEFLQSAGSARGRDHMRAFAGKRDREGIADAARAAGDERDAGGEGFGHLLILFDAGCYHGRASQRSAAPVI